jgi:hypothetical protein
MNEDHRYNYARYMAMIDAARVINSRYHMTRPEINREAPKYRLVLRAFGAFFDQEKASHVTLAELEGGYIWHFFPHGDLRHPAYGMITDEEVPDFVESVKRSRIEQAAVPPRQKRSRSGHALEILHSGGYEETFRSLSHKFDNDRLSAILLVEGSGGWAIAACLPVPVFIQANESRKHDINYIHERIFTHEELNELSTDLRSYRGRQAS